MEEKYMALNDKNKAIINSAIDALIALQNGEAKDMTVFEDIQDPATRTRIIELLKGVS